MGLDNNIIGKELLNLGTVYIASNKPENVFLLILKTEDENTNISVLYDRRFDVLMVSRDYMNIGIENNEEENDREVEITPTQKKQIIDFIESYEIK